METRLYVTLKKKKEKKTCVRKAKEDQTKSKNSAGIPKIIKMKLSRWKMTQSRTKGMTHSTGEEYKIKPQIFASAGSLSVDVEVKVAE